MKSEHDKVENEEHVLLEGPLYFELRESLNDNLSPELPNILPLPATEKLSALLSCQRFDSIRSSAKICHII